MSIKKVFTAPVGTKITTKDCINSYPCPCCDSKSVKRVEKKTKSTILDFNGQLLPAHEKWSIRFFSCTNCLHDYSIIEKNNELWANGDNLSPIEEFEIFWKYMDNEFCLSAYIDEDVYKTVPYDDIRDWHIENFITYMKNAGLVLNNSMENEWDIRMSSSDKEKHNIQTNRDFIDYLVGVVEKVVPISEYEESEYTQELDNEKYLAFSPYLDLDTISTEFPVACFIGRFQIPHEIHFLHLKNAYKKYGKVIVLVGSSNRSRDPKNPFTVEERVSIFKEYMKNNFIPDDAVQFIGIPDFKSIQKWTDYVKNEVQKVHQGAITLIGSYKDASSFYLDLFPEWEQDFSPQIKGFSSSYYRDPYWEDGEISLELPKETQKFMENFKNTREYFDIRQFDRGNKNYQRNMKKIPFPVPFLTGDALVECNGHILLIRRNSECGNDQLALPGGFFESGLKYNPNTQLFEMTESRDNNFTDAAIREMSEEAGLSVNGVVIPKKTLVDSVVQEKIYSEADRSLRWRIITQVAHINLKMDTIPVAYAGSDAKEAIWMPISELRGKENEFFEDHFLIIDDLLGIY